ncbi:hypothetical protein [Actinoplanes sp. NPDC051851]|uniref:hypothetical protein n=1 Tax=Actinoplanes sp. NPDC051851 TaxID=3154753 RepID=UPI00342354F1
MSVNIAVASTRHNGNGVAARGAWPPWDRSGGELETPLLAGQDVDDVLRRQAGSDHPGVLQAVRLSLDGLAVTDPGGDAARLLRVLSLLSPDGISRDLLARAEQHLGLTGNLWTTVGVLADALLAAVSGDRPAAGLGDECRITVHRLTALVIRHQASLPPGDDLQTALDTTAALLDEITARFPKDQVARRRGELDELAAHLDTVLHHARHTGGPSPLLLVQATWIAGPRPDRSPTYPCHPPLRQPQAATRSKNSKSGSPRNAS